MKKWIGICMLGALLFSGCGKSEETEPKAAQEIAIKENQEILYGQIESIVGNEMKIALADAKEADSGSQSGTGGEQPEQPSEGWGKSEAGEFEEQTTAGDGTIQVIRLSGAAAASGGGQSVGPQQGGTPHDMGGGQMPSGGEFPSESGETEESEKSKDTESTTRETQKQQSRITYTLTGEEKEMTIPVGTVVTTSLGNTTTFSRLAAGDMLKMVVQTDESSNEIIVGIWIVG